MSSHSFSLPRAARAVLVALAAATSLQAQAPPPTFDASVSDRFGPQPPFSFSHLAGLLARDFDGDSHPDIAATGNTILRISFGDAAGNTRVGSPGTELEFAL